METKTLVIQTEIEKIVGMLQVEDRRQKERESDPNYQEVLIVDYPNLINTKKLRDEQAKK